MHSFHFLQFIEVVGLVVVGQSKGGRAPRRSARGGTRQHEAAQSERWRRPISFPIG